MIALHAKTTYIKLTVYGPEAVLSDVKIAKYQGDVSACLNKLIDTYYPSLWYDFCSNPCEAAGHECIISSRRSSLGGKEHLMRCPQHAEVMQASVMGKWFGKYPSYSLTKT